MLELEDAERFGFEWPDTETLTGTRSPRIQVTRCTSITRRNGEYRVVRVQSKRETLEVYVSPTGLLRVFKEGAELQ